VEVASLDFVPPIEQKFFDHLKEAVRPQTWENLRTISFHVSNKRLASALAIAVCGWKCYEFPFRKNLPHSKGLTCGSCASQIGFWDYAMGETLDPVCSHRSYCPNTTKWWETFMALQDMVNKPIEEQLKISLTRI